MVGRVEAAGSDGDGRDDGGGLGASGEADGVSWLALGLGAHAPKISGTHTRSNSSFIGGRMTEDAACLLLDS